MKRLTLALLAVLFASTLARARVKVHVINVGQAEAILLEFKSADVVIDASGEDTSTDDGVGDLTGYLDKFFDARPDLRDTTGRRRGIIVSLIANCKQTDHTRNLKPVMNRYKVLNLMDGGANSGSGITQLQAARAIASRQGAIYNRVANNF